MNAAVSSSPLYACGARKIATELLELSNKVERGAEGDEAYRLLGLLEVFGLEDEWQRLESVASELTRHCAGLTAGVRARGELADEIRALAKQLTD